VLKPDNACDRNLYILVGAGAKLERYGEEVLPSVETEKTWGRDWYLRKGLRNRSVMQRYHPSVNKIGVAMSVL
jgi:hypothetical protein